MDAIDLMNRYRRDKTVFDVVDLDPYGTVIPFLEGSITSLANNGLLCVTFTDMAFCARDSPTYASISTDLHLWGGRIATSRHYAWFSIR